ncbi:hypothetical protein BGZ65_008438, partial [Modicella reniformis]
KKKKKKKKIPIPPFFLKIPSDSVHVDSIVAEDLDVIDPNSNWNDVLNHDHELRHLGCVLNHVETVDGFVLEPWEHILLESEFRDGFKDRNI